MSRLEQHFANVFNINVNEIVPGVLVSHVDWPTSLGIIVSVWRDGGEEVALVIWTSEPGTFVMPNVNRVFPGLIKNDIIQVQPMSLPSTLFF